MIAFAARLRALTSLLLAALLLLTGSVSALAASGTPEAVPWEEMEYEHYDPAGFKEKTEALTAAAEEGDTDTVLSLYDELYDASVLVFTYSCMAQIHNSQDVNDDYWADELVYSNALTVELSDLLSVACHQVLEGPCGDAFAAHVGDRAAQEFRDYEPMLPRELELTEQESKLVNEYTALMDKQNDTVYTYNGEDWTLDRLDGEDGDALSENEYYDILYGVYDVLSLRAADIYRQLTAIRTELARINGYDDYNQYAYDELNSRDYTVEQALTLFEEIKEISRQIYYSPALDMTDEIAPVYDDPEDMLAVLHEYTSRVDPVFDTSWQFMTENGLCDLSTGAGRDVGAYTTWLPAYGGMFTYSDEVGSVFALSTLFHEFGHFTANWLAPPKNYLTDTVFLDVAEIHSTGMELLILPFYDEIYEEGADIARYNTLYNALCAVTDQALFAEFEARIYADPETYSTAEALNKLYNDVSVEYGYPDLGTDPTWITIPHFFESPNYTVSYVTAALASIQIWAASQEDWQAGVDIYMDIVRQGPSGLNYFDVLADAGLKGFDTAGVATEVCGQLLDALAALDSEILDGGAPADEEAPGADVLTEDASEPDEEETPEEPADVLNVETQSLFDAPDGEPEEETPDVLA